MKCLISSIILPVDNIEKLCLYFECTPNGLMTTIPEEGEGRKKEAKK